jgi:hypothetical protein
MGQQAMARKDLDRPAMASLFSDSRASTMVRPEPMINTRGIHWSNARHGAHIPRIQRRRIQTTGVTFVACAPPGTCQWPIPLGTAQCTAVIQGQAHASQLYLHVDDLGANMIQA